MLLVVEYLLLIRDDAIQFCLIGNYCLLIGNNGGLVRQRLVQFRLIRFNACLICDDGFLIGQDGLLIRQDGPLIKQHFVHSEQESQPSYFSWRKVPNLSLKKSRSPMCYLFTTFPDDFRIAVHLVLSRKLIRITLIRFLRENEIVTKMLGWNCAPGR